MTHNAEHALVRLYVESTLAPRGRVGLSVNQAHYALHVMRARAGDPVLLFNGCDGEWIARIAEISKRDCVLACERQVRGQAATPDFWLCFAPIKKTPADYVAQKATELGVRVLQPVLTRRTVVSRINLERMRGNAIEAAEQSGRLTVPKVREQMPLEKLLALWPENRSVLFCDETGEAPPIADFLSAQPARDLEAWAVLTGPEGGFDPAERESIRARQFVRPVSLGSRILRADTAALAALTVLQALRGDWR